MEIGGAGLGLLVGIAVAVVVCWLSGPDFDCVKAGAWFVVIGMLGGLFIDWQWWRKDRWSDKRD
jgi:hypothetical protein